MCALKSSGFGGTNTLHELKGCSCDLCGKEADSETAEVVAMDCSFKTCPPEACLYHQACLERYLKSIKCERNRKIGFPCPRGCGKATRFSSPCPGKILKSHPISIRGEANKKRRQAELESLQRSNSNDKDGQGQGAKSQKKGEDAKGSKNGSPEDKSQKGKAMTKQASIKALNVSGSSKSLLSAASSSSSISAVQAPAKSSAAAKKEQLALAARNLKSEIAARQGGAAAKAHGHGMLLSSASMGAIPMAHTSGKAKEVKTLDEYLAERHASGAGALERATSSASMPPPAANAWASKSRASSTSSLAATEPGPLGDSLTPSFMDSEAFPPPPAPMAAPPPSGRPPVPLPRSSSAASSAAGAAGGGGAAAAAPSSAAAAPVVPAPAKPPPPRGAWAQKQPAVMSIVPPPPPPPKPVPGLPTGVQQKAEAHAATQAQQPAQPKLSKSQRKNLRRAEKKASGAATSRTSQDEGAGDNLQGSELVASQEQPAAAAAAAATAAEPAMGQATTPRHARAAATPASPMHPVYSPDAAAAATAALCSSPSSVHSTASASAPGPGPGMAAYHSTPQPLCADLGPVGPPLPPPLPCGPAGDLLDRCLQLVVQHKLQKQVESLASLGFPPSSALAAVQQHGGNLEAAVAMLLEQAVGGCDAMMQPPLGMGSSGPLPEVDLSEELAVMQMLQCKYGLPPGVLESAVIDCNGDLEGTARTIAEQCGDTGGPACRAGSAMMGAAGPELLLGGDGGGGLFDAPLPAVQSAHHAALAPPLQQGNWLARDPWQQPAAEGVGDSGGSGSPFGQYSAFSFGGFTEAALHAVHGGAFGPGGSGGGLGTSSSSTHSLFGSLDNSSLGGATPRHAPGGTARTSLLWGREPGAGLGLPPTSPQALAAPSSPMYAAQLSGVRAGGSGLHHHLGMGDLGATHALSPFDRPLHLSAAASPPYAHPGLVADDVGARPEAGLLIGGLGGLQQQQQRLPAGLGWVGGGSCYSGALQPQQEGLAGGRSQYGGAEEHELSDLMSTLLCR